jgi:hypothetical protein
MGAKENENTVFMKKIVTVIQKYLFLEILINIEAGRVN